jgi:NTP pyrophosphatase (non-canonical NTP hydrolase)
VQRGTQAEGKAEGKASRPWALGSLGEFLEWLHRRKVLNKTKSEWGKVLISIIRYQPKKCKS